MGESEATDEEEEEEELEAPFLTGMELDLFIQADDWDRWSLHRKEPWWVVGEQTQAPFGDPVGGATVADESPVVLRLTWVAMAFSIIQPFFSFFLGFWFRIEQERQRVCMGI